VPGNNEHDLSHEDLERARELVPIPCIDVLPWRRGDADRLEVCLIERADRPGSWNLVGGRIRHGETISAAVGRHLAETLGERATWRRTDFNQPETIGEYLQTATPGYGFDPRQHAVSFSYTFEMAGEIRLGGEARSHEWFGLENLPDRREIGYGQGDVVYRLIPAVRRQAAGGYESA
jgi:ADP-ribose pyrophosphatase YjhB (NUDIX family)